MKNDLKPTRSRSISYAKWGYIFIAPFFIAYICCTLIPQLMTFYNSLFMNYRDGLMQVGPKFVGLDNYVKLFSPDNTGNIGILKYFGNTMALWVLGAVPQFAIALLLAVFFTSYRLNIKGQNFFKTVIYMPNLIMASAFSMLFFTLFSNVGPINQILTSTGLADTVIDFFSMKITVRSMISLMNFLMWFGNTTILLMAAVMGIDPGLYEAAEIDGCTPGQMFRRITLPLIRPILVYVVITSMIGGLQMFDVPQILTNGKGSPDRCATTMIMYLNNHMYSKNYGMAGAVSTVLFLVCAVLCIAVLKTLDRSKEGGEGK